MGPAAHPVSLCLSLGQYKASYSRHFISPDKQERQDKEIFRQNMKRRLETFKSTKHNICSSKSKARLKEKGRKKASGPQTAAPLLAVRFGLPERSCRGWVRCCRASASPEPMGTVGSPPQHLISILCGCPAGMGPAWVLHVPVFPSRQSCPMWSRAPEELKVSFPSTLRATWGQRQGLHRAGPSQVPLALQKDISLTSDAPNGRTHRGVPWQEAGEAGGRRGPRVLQGVSTLCLPTARSEARQLRGCAGTRSFSCGCRGSVCRVPGPHAPPCLAAAPVLVMVSSEEEESDSSETEREDDEGIVFIARATDEVLQGKATPGRHRHSHTQQGSCLASSSFLRLQSKADLGCAKPKSAEHG